MQSFVDIAVSFALAGPFRIEENGMDPCFAGDKRVTQDFLQLFIP